jgi:hypothetical protein
MNGEVVVRTNKLFKPTAAHQRGNDKRCVVPARLAAF